jgi:hypothetical protein
MTTTPQTNPAIQILVDGLSGAVPVCDPQNAAQTALVTRQLRELRSQLVEGGANGKGSDLGPLLDVAISLIEHVARQGLVGPRETMVLLEDILIHVRGSLGIPPPAPAAPAAPPPADDGTRAAGLQLIDGRRIGEILVTLSMLTQADVEKALKVQKVTGRRLGEALVQMRLLTPDMVEAALRIQRVRSKRWIEPWKEAKPPAAP